MRDKHAHGSGNFILSAVAILAIVICVVWIYLQSEEIRQKSSYMANQRDRIDSLQQQLADVRTHSEILQEKSLQLQNDLTNTMASLDEELANNWQEKYDNLQEQYLQIKKYSEQESIMAGNEEERLYRALRFHRSENNIMRNSLSELNKKRDETEEIIAQLKADNEQTREIINDLEEQLHQARGRLAEKPAVVENITADMDEIQQYRRIRLQSLRNALVKQDSTTRKAILLDVIPTIPSGIKAAELLPLVEGMHSGDILAVIQASYQYMSRPIDNNSISILAGTMNDEDAVIASLVLSGQ